MTCISIEYGTPRARKPNSPSPETTRALHQRSPGKAIRRIVAGTALLSVSACSAITDPYVGMSGAPVAPTFDEAVEFARDKSGEMESKLAELEQWDVSTGTLIFGSGLSALAFAAFGSHPDAILGAGLAGGAGYGARSFLPIQDRKVAYSTGATAIECAITAIGLGVPVEEEGDPIAPAGFGSGQSNPILRAVDDLETAAQRAPAFAMALEDPEASVAVATVERSSAAPIVAQTARLQAQRELLMEAVDTTRRAALRLASSTRSALDMRGPRLIAATGAVVDQVRTQLMAARVDPDAALEALRSKAGIELPAAQDDAETVQEGAMAVERQSTKVQAAVEGLEQRSVEIGGSDLSRNAVSILAQRSQETAAEEVEQANEMAAAAVQILKLIELGTECLGGRPAES